MNRKTMAMSQTRAAGARAPGARVPEARVLPDRAATRSSLLGQIVGPADRHAASFLLAGAVLKLLEDAERAIDSDPGAARAHVSRVLVLLNGHGVDIAREPQAPTPDLPPSGAPAAAGAPARGLAAWKQRRIEAHIDDHIHRPLSAPALAALVDLSPSHFSKAFKRTYGIVPSIYVLRRRVELAQQAMLASDQSLSQIALSHGFADQPHFCRVFRRLTGVTPSQWRRIQQAGASV